LADGDDQDSTQQRTGTGGSIEDAQAGGSDVEDVTRKDGQKRDVGKDEKGDGELEQQGHL